MIFLFFGFPLARLEPELELFEVDDIGDDGDDDLSHHYHLNYSMSYIFGKLMHQRLILADRKPF